MIVYEFRRNPKTKEVYLDQVLLETDTFERKGLYEVRPGWYVSSWSPSADCSEDVAHLWRAEELADTKPVTFHASEDITNFWNTAIDWMCWIVKEA